MNEQFRDRVVELLRCAADLDSTVSEAAVVVLGEPMSRCGEVTEAALAAVIGFDWLTCMTYQDVLLEAAARVEEGSFP